MSQELPVAKNKRAVLTGHPADVASMFDDMYAGQRSYWWNGPGQPRIRLTPDPLNYSQSLMTSTVLHVIQNEGLVIDRIADIGSGEGYDAVRYAKMGYKVTAIDVSVIGLDKTLRLAKKHGVSHLINLVHGTAQDMELDKQSYGLVLCNGVLNYVQGDDNKKMVLKHMQQAVPPGGWNAVSCWINYPPEKPECHNIVEMYPDIDGRITFGAYCDKNNWQMRIGYRELNRADTSHPSDKSHSHSHSKILAQKVV